MEYTKQFACFEELSAFIDFHREETGLLFSSNRELKTAWIEVDEKLCQELRLADW
jgi:hypothetical protein